MERVVPRMLGRNSPKPDGQSCQHEFGVCDLQGAYVRETCALANTCMEEVFVPSSLRPLPEPAIELHRKIPNADGFSHASSSRTSLTEIAHFPAVGRSFTERFAFAKDMLMAEKHVVLAREFRELELKRERSHRREERSTAALWLARATGTHALRIKQACKFSKA